MAYNMLRTILSPTVGDAGSASREPAPRPGYPAGAVLAGE